MRSTHGPVQRGNKQFAVYAGDGVYLSAVAVGNVRGESIESIAFAGPERSIRLARCEAVAACHVARRAGVPAWIVRHPVDMAKWLVDVARVCR